MRSQVLVISAHADRRIFAEINSLAESGRIVTFVSTADVPADALHPAVRVVMPEPRRRPPPRPRGLRTPIATAARALLAPARALLAPARPWIWARRMRARIHRFQSLTPPASYDAIHCHDLDTLPSPTLSPPRRPRKADLRYPRTLPPPAHCRAFQRYWWRVAQKFLGGADRIIAPNESMCAQLARLYGVPMPAAIYNSYGSATNAAPLSLDNFHRHFDVPPGAFRVVFQGGLLPLRNLPNLTRAFAHLDASYRLLIIGSGPMEQSVRDLCQRHAIGNVHLGGFILQADLLRYTVHADVGSFLTKTRLLNMRYCAHKLFEFIEAKVPICGQRSSRASRVVAATASARGLPNGVAGGIARALRLPGRCAREFTPAAATRRKEVRPGEQGKRLIRLYEQLGV